MHIIKTLLVSLFIIGCSNGEKNRNESVKNILNIFKNNQLTIDNYYHFYGSGAEGEIIILLGICETLGSSLEKLNCKECVKNIGRLNSKNKSIYLTWLKSKMPKIGEYKIIEVNEIKKTGVLEHELVKVSLSEGELILFRTLNEKMTQQFGEIHITAINGIDVKELFENELKLNAFVNYRKDIINNCAN